MKRFYTVFPFLSIAFALIGCATENVDNVSNDTGEFVGGDYVESGFISMEDAFEAALDAGVLEDRLIYFDMLPYIISPEEAESTWGFIEKLGEDEYAVTYIDQWTGEIIELQEPPTANILDFMDQTELTSLEIPPYAGGSSPNSYNSFPWNWRLPMESGSFYLTCGYGCYNHTGSIYYSTDWSNGSTGHLLESPASCWVLYTTYSASYGNQIVAECGNAGSGKRYYYRLGHMRSSARVSPGWWIGKGRDIGYIGNTGYSTGPHVHYETLRAYGFSGGSFSGHDDLPQNNWPSSSDGLCDGDLNGYSFYGAPYHHITVHSDGCP